MLIALTLVAGWPLVRTFFLSFTDASLSDLGAANLIGFENYLVYDGMALVWVLADSVWWQSVWNTVYFSVVSVSLEVVFGVIVALILNAEFQAASIVRAGADSLGNPHHCFGANVGMDAQRPIRHHQSPVDERGHY